MRDVTICYGMTETSPVSFQTCTEGELDCCVRHAFFYNERESGLVCCVKEVAGLRATVLLGL